MTDWLNDDWRTDELTDQRTQPADWQTDGRIDDWQTDGRIDDWQTDGLGLTEWQVNGSRTEIYYDWPVMSDYLNRPDSLKWPITRLTYSLAYWLTGWMINPTSSGRNNFVPLIILLKDRLNKSGLGMVRIT